MMRTFAYHFKTWKLQTSELGLEQFNKFLIMFARLCTRHWKLPFHNFFHNFSATFLSPSRIHRRTILSLSLSYLQLIGFLSRYKLCNHGTTRKLLRLPAYFLSIQLLAHTHTRTRGSFSTYSLSFSPAKRFLLARTTLSLSSYVIVSGMYSIHPRTFVKGIYNWSIIHVLSQESRSAFESNGFKVEELFWTN